MLIEYLHTLTLAMHQNRMERTEVFPRGSSTYGGETLAQLHPFPGRIGDELEVNKQDGRGTVAISKDVLVFR